MVYHLAGKHQLVGVGRVPTRPLQVKMTTKGLRKPDPTNGKL